MPQRDVIEKILVLRFSSLGDIVMATPMIRCLRTSFPNAQIDMVVRGDFLDLIQNNPHLNNKIGLPRTSGFRGLINLIQDINHANYDLIYDAHWSLRTLFLMPFLRAKAKRYFKKHYVRRSLALTFKLPLLKNAKRMLEKYIEPLHDLGVKYDGKSPEIFLNAKTVERVKLQFSPYTHPAIPTVGLIPSAQWPGKRWPVPLFRQLMENLFEKTPYRLIVFGGPKDTFCEALCEGFSKERVANAQGALTIEESAALLSLCSFVVANDTGLMHVADALKLPSVLILGPTSKELGCLPFHPLSHIVEENLWCRPCSKNGQAPCIRGKRVCLELISPEQVFRNALHLAKQLALPA